jgi:TRAP-type C4-dicarboxylate transport system substrate-binding protein
MLACLKPLSLAAVLLALAASAAFAQTADAPAQTAEASTRTAEVPTRAVEVPAAPAELPAKPAEVPATPAEVPAKAAEAPAKTAEVVLRFGSINTPGTSTYEKVLVPFARALEQASGGRIEVALKPLGGYGKPTELFTMVEKGDIDIASTVQGYHPGRFPQSSVMELPLMFANSVAGTEAMMTLHKEGLLDKDYASVKVLALYVLPPYPIFTTGKKIQSVRDFRGLRLRTPSTTVGVALAKLGAIPLGIPLNLIGDTIASGYVDAIAYGWDSVTTARGHGGKVLIEQLSSVVDAQLAAPALMVVMNRAKWDALSQDLKDIIDKHSLGLARANAELREGQEASTKKKLQADPRLTSFTLDDAQRAELQRLTMPAIQEWKAGMAKQGLDGEKLYARARELIQQKQVAQK